MGGVINGSAGTFIFLMMEITIASCIWVCMFAPSFE